MTDFKKYNRKASFRGVEFDVRDDTYESGRRLETHEYPGSNTPMTEDLGRKAYKIQLTAFVNGKDWRKRATRLQDALDLRGPGELVHPNGKKYTVCVDGYNVHESLKIYESEFTITFVESGAQPAPMITSALVDRLASIAGTLNIASATEFLKLSADYVAESVSTVSSVASAIVDNLSQIVDGIQDTADTLTSGLDSAVSVALELDDLKTNVEILLATPDKWAARVQGAVAVINQLLPATKKNIHNVLHSADTDVKPENILQLTESGKSTYRAAVRTNNFNIATSISGAITTLADIDVSRRRDIIEIRNDLLNSADKILNSDIDMSVEFTTAVADATTNAVAVCNEIIARLPEEREIELNVSTPARVLAHELYNDQSRGADIAAENLVQNPTFLPSGTQLQVLNK